MKKLFILLGLVFVQLLNFAQAADDAFLSIDEAYQLSYQRDGEALTFHWDIAPGYFLYHKAFKIKNIEGDIKFGKTEYSNNSIVSYDEIFQEDVTKFYDFMEVRVPYTDLDGGKISVSFQGCADAGLCFPPSKRTIQLSDIELIEDKITIAQSGALPLPTKDTSNAAFLKVDDAYKFSYERKANILTFYWDIAPDYYLYEKSFELEIKNGDMEIGQANFSANSITTFDELVYNGNIQIFYDYMEVKVPYKADGDATFTIRYQGCADAGLCYPPKKQTLRLSDMVEGLNFQSSSFTQPVNPFESGTNIALEDLTQFNNTTTTEVSDPVLLLPEEDQNMGLIMAMLFALIGGMFLNLMPCVFPVLSLKAMQLAQVGEESKKAHLHSWVYTIGVVSSFIAIAGVLLVFRSFGEAVGWGFQLQSPYFVVALIYVFFMLSLSMAGIFHVGQGFMGVGQGLTEKPGSVGSFFTGVLATVVATPCTAPFMGSAIALALSQPAWWALLVFSAMGFGLALPILLFTWIPALHRWMPRPGAWMDNLKQLLCFPLFATVVWLLWVLVQQVEHQGFFAVGLGLVLLAFMSWPTLSRNGSETPFWKIAKPSLRIVSLIGAIYLVIGIGSPEVDDWEDFDKYRLQQYMKDDRPILIDVTAAWCITCKANEKVALSGDRFDKTMNKYNVRLIEADWTNEDPDITALLAQFGRNSVPLYVVYQKGEAPMILPQILTADIVEDAFKALK